MQSVYFCSDFKCPKDMRKKRAQPKLGNNKTNCPKKAKRPRIIFMCLNLISVPYSHHLVIYSCPWLGIMTEKLTFSFINQFKYHV